MHACMHSVGFGCACSGLSSGWQQAAAAAQHPAARHARGACRPACALAAAQHPPRIGDALSVDAPCLAVAHHHACRQGATEGKGALGGKGRTRWGFWSGKANASTGQHARLILALMPLRRCRAAAPPRCCPAALSPTHLSAPGRHLKREPPGGVTPCSPPRCRRRLARRTPPAAQGCSSAEQVCRVPQPHHIAGHACMVPKRQHPPAPPAPASAHLGNALQGCGDIDAVQRIWVVQHYLKHLLQVWCGVACRGVAWCGVAYASEHVGGMLLV